MSVVERKVRMDIFKPRQKKLSWIQVLLVLILGVGLLGAVSVTACEGPKIVTVTQNYSIDAGEKRVISIVLKRNDRLDLSVTVASNDIGIEVDDPSGQAAVPFNRVESGNFVVIAKEDGTYVVTLDNSYSTFTPKSITVVLKYPER